MTVVYGRDLNGFYVYAGRKGEKVYYQEGSAEERAKAQALAIEMEQAKSRAKDVGLRNTR
jgi:hypothetical protein